MAIAPVNKFINISVPVVPGVQKLYEVPTGTTSLLLYAQVANVGVNTYPTVTFWQKRTQRSTNNDRDIRTIKDVEIPPNDAVILVDGRMVLEKTPLVVDSLLISGVTEKVGIITGVDYDEPTGIATVMCLNKHQMDKGDGIAMNGIYFDCGTYFTPGNNTTYDPQTGLLVLDLGNHSLQVGDTLIISDYAMQFTCTQGSGTHAYPRPTDPVSGKSLAISAVTATTATVQVLDTVPSTNTTTHSFVADSGVYNSVLNNAYSGITTNIFPNPQQGYQIETIVDNVGTSKTFTTHLGGGGGNRHIYKPSIHTFKRALPRAIEVVESSGELDQLKLTPTTGTAYNPSTGILDVTTTGLHGMSPGDRVKFAAGAFVFTCDEDSQATTHAYPRPTDPAYDKWLEVISTPSTTRFTVQVLGTTPSTNVTAHYYSSGGNESITRGGRQFDVTMSTYNPVSGEITFTIGPNSLANNDKIKIAEESIIYSCTMDYNMTEHAYPRSTDPAGGDATLTMAISEVNNGIRCNVGSTLAGGFVGPLQMELQASILENSNV